MNIRIFASRLAIAGLALAGLVLTVASATFGSAPPAEASFVAPIYPPYPGSVSANNPRCSELGAAFGGGQAWSELVVSSPDDGGTFSDGTLTVSIDVTSASTADLFTFAWSASAGVDAVLVKQASDTHAVYLYASGPASTEATADSGLSPKPGSSPSGGVGHLAFCYDPGSPGGPNPTNTPTAVPATATSTPTGIASPTPTRTPTPTASPTPTRTPTPTVTPIVVEPPPAVATPTRTPTATPTRTPTRTPTVGAGTPVPPGTPVNPSATPTSTPTPVSAVAGAQTTATPTHTPTATPTPAATRTPTRPAATGTPPVPTPPSEPSPPAPPDDGIPDALGDISYLGDFFEGGGDVATTNVLMVLFLAFLLLAGGALFNEALEENNHRIHMPHAIPSALAPVSHGWRAVWAPIVGAWAAIVPGATWVDRAVSPIALLALTGLIYTFLEPGVSFDEETLVLFLSLVVSKGVLTVLYEGGKAQLYRRYLNVSAGMKLFPACIVIALVSVLISRIGDLRPGFVVGFVATAMLFQRPADDTARTGRAYSFIAAALLTASVVAWLVAWPLHELNEGRSGFWASLPEAMALAVFVVCLEGLMFSLLPLKFMDGARIWDWSKFAWLALFLPTAFLFAQVLFNDTDAYLDLFSRQRSLATVAVLSGYLFLTFGTWAYFRWRVEQGEPRPPEPSAAR